MRGFTILLGRELRATFHSFGVYLLLAVVTAITAFAFRGVLIQTGGELDFALSGLHPWLFWLSVILAPLLTMRLFAEERRSGSLELLMTAPVTDAQVVAAKYFSSVLVYAVFLIPLWILHGVIALVWDAPVDWGQLLATTLGLMSLSFVFLAIGLLASAFGSMQLWAGLTALIGNMVLLSLGGIHRAFPAGSRPQQFFSYINLNEHLATALGGVLDLRYFFLHLSVVGLILFWTTRTVEARKWR